VHNQLVKWEADLHDDFVPEYHDLNRDVQDELLAHVGLLEKFGPQLGRPRVDTLKGSRHPNMKELRLKPRTEHGGLSLRLTPSAGPSSCAAATNQAAVKSASTAN